MENKFAYLLLPVVLLVSIVVFRTGLVAKNFDSVEEAYEYYYNCEVSLTVEGEKSVLALGMKDGEIVRDYFFSERKSIRSKIFNEHKGNDRQYNSFCT